MKRNFKGYCERCHKRERATKYARYCKECRKIRQRRGKGDPYGAKDPVDLSNIDHNKDIGRFGYLQDIMNPERLIQEIEKILEKIFLTKTKN